jgi:hypothetical protein
LILLCFLFILFYFILLCYVCVILFYFVLFCFILLFAILYYFITLIQSHNRQSAHTQTPSSPQGEVSPTILLVLLSKTMQSTLISLPLNSDSSYFNKSNRGFPDVSAVGHNYLVAYLGQFTPVDGYVSHSLTLALTLTSFSFQQNTRAAFRANTPHFSPLRHSHLLSNTHKHFFIFIFYFLFKKNPGCEVGRGIPRTVG